MKRFDIEDAEILIEHIRDLGNTDPEAAHCFREDLYLILVEEASKGPRRGQQPEE